MFHMFIQNRSTEVFGTGPPQKKKAACGGGGKADRSTSLRASLSHWSLHRPLPSVMNFLSLHKKDTLGLYIKGLVHRIVSCDLEEESLCVVSCILFFLSPVLKTFFREKA